MLCKSRPFGMCCITKAINDRIFFFFLQVIATPKIIGSYHLPMIDLGNSKEVTAVKTLNSIFSNKKDFSRIFNIAFRFGGLKLHLGRNV